jgi:hypothetical protein
MVACVWMVDFFEDSNDSSGPIECE